VVTGSRAFFGEAGERGGEVGERGTVGAGDRADGVDAGLRAGELGRRAAADADEHGVIEVAAGGEQVAAVAGERVEGRGQGLALELELLRGG
jgi:hypothetical protein